MPDNRSDSARSAAGLTASRNWLSPILPAILALMATVSMAIVSTATAKSPELQLGDIQIAPNLQSFELENGLRIVVIPDHRAPVVTHMVWYKVGSADEPPGKSGIAHLLEHLMFKGTTDYPDGFSSIVSELGGQENAFTSYDHTVYFQRVAKEHLPRMMALEADRMANLVLTEEETEPELSVVLQERSSRIDAEPGARLGEAMTAALFVESAYGRPIIGWGIELMELTRDDAIAFYERFYSPNNAIVVIAGDVTVDAVRAMAEATYGQVERRVDDIPRYRAREPEPHAKRSVELRDPQVTQPSVSRTWVVPSYPMSGDSGEAEVLDVMATVLGGGNSSILHDILVRQKKRALSVGAFYGGDNLGADRFGVYGTPAEGVTAEELMADIQQIIDDLSPETVTQAAVDFVIRRKVASTIYAQDSQSTLARIFGAGLAAGTSIERIQNWPAGIQEVTAEEVLAAARQYLSEERSVTGYLKPLSEEITQ